MRALKVKNKAGVSFSNRFRFHTYEAGTENEIAVSDWQENVVSIADTHGINLFIRQLFGDVSYALPVTRARFGTTNVTPVESDDDIDTPFAYDIEIADREYISTNGLRLYFFAPDAFIPDDTYYTFATYCGDQTFSMALLDTPFVKSGSVDTTIEYEYYINNA